MHTTDRVSSLKPPIPEPGNLPSEIRYMHVIETIPGKAAPSTPIAKVCLEVMRKEAIGQPEHIITLPEVILKHCEKH